MPKVYSAFSVWPRLFWSKVKWGWGNKNKSGNDGESSQHQVLIHSSSCIVNIEHDAGWNQNKPKNAGLFWCPWAGSGCSKGSGTLIGFPIDTPSWSCIQCYCAEEQPNVHLDVTCETTKDISEQLDLRLFVFAAHFNSCGRFVFSSKCNENFLFARLTSEPWLNCTAAVSILWNGGTADKQKHMHKMFEKILQTGCRPKQHAPSRWKHKCRLRSLNWVS